MELCACRFGFVESMEYTIPKRKIKIGAMGGRRPKYLYHRKRGDAGQKHLYIVSGEKDEGKNGKD